jgi:hypothetical protein
MGITGLFQTLSNHGLSPPAADVRTFLAEQSPSSPVHLDLFGTFWYDIRSRLIDAKLHEDDIEEVGRRLAFEIKELFGTSNAVIHIDGAACTEKRKAHQGRHERRLAKQPILEKDVNALEKNSRNGKWTSKKIMRNIAKSLKEIHIITEEDKGKLEMGLRSCYEVCRCATEADACIGCHEELHKRVVISSDSDLLAYQGVSTLIRPLPHQRRKFGVYKTEDVISALELPSQSHLTLFASISDNDYSKNLKNLGPARNLLLVRDIQQDDLTRMLQDYLEGAGKLLKLDVSTQKESFELALRVFATGKQTPVLEPLSNQTFEIFLDRIKTSKELRYSTALEKRMLRSGE